MHRDITATALNGPNDCTSDGACDRRKMIRNFTDDVFKTRALPFFKRHNGKEKLKTSIFFLLKKNKTKMYTAVDVNKFHVLLSDIYYKETTKSLCVMRDKNDAALFI